MLHFLYFIGYILGLVSGTVAFSGLNPVVLIVIGFLLYLVGGLLLERAFSK